MEDMEYIEEYASIELKWTGRSRIPKINGHSYKMIKYSPILAFNQGVPKFQFKGETYGCFYSNHLPEIQNVYFLDMFGLGRYITCYFTSLEYDGNPFFIVLFILLDTHTKRMYESYLCHRASDKCQIDIDAETNALTLTDGDVVIHKDEYEKKVGAAMICMDIMDQSNSGV